MQSRQSSMQRAAATGRTAEQHATCRTAEQRAACDAAHSMQHAVQHTTCRADSAAGRPGRLPQVQDGRHLQRSEVRLLQQAGSNDPAVRADADEDPALPDLRLSQAASMQPDRAGRPSCRAGRACSLPDQVPAQPDRAGRSMQPDRAGCVITFGIAVGQCRAAQTDRQIFEKPISK